MQSSCKFGVLVFSAVCASLWALPAAGQNKAFESAEKIPAGVHSVSTGGFWNSGTAEGFYRSVVIAGGVEHVSHRLFIQWLQNDSKNQTYQLIRTMNIKELNLGAGYVLEVKTSFGDINLFKISVKASSRGSKTKLFDVTAKGGGGYTIRPR
jgi:hypothetical protein